MAKPCTPRPIAQRVQLFKHQTGNVGGSKGTPLAFLWGIQRGYSLRKENTPLVPRRARRSPPSHPCEKAGHSLSRGSPPLPRAAPSALPSPPHFRAENQKATAFSAVASLSALLQNLFVAVGGLHAQLFVEDRLADAQVLGRDLKQLVVGEELEALLQAHLLGRDKAQRVVRAGSAHVRQLLLLAHVDRDVLLLGD